MVTTILLIVSLAGFLMLLAPANWLGILQAVGVPLLLLGGLIVWKKPQQKWKTIPWFSYVAAALPVTSLGFGFYEKLSKAGTPLPVLLAILCSVCSVWFVAGCIQQVRQFTAAHKNAGFVLLRNLLLAVLTAVFVVHFSQTLLGLSPKALPDEKFRWNVLTVLLVIVMLYCIIGKIRISVVIGTGLFLLLAVADTYIYLFRERLIEPVDIFSLGTAINVAGNYSLFPVPNAVLQVLSHWAGLILLMYWLLPGPELTGWKIRVSLALCCIVGFVSLSRYNSTLKTYHWQKEGPAAHGLILDFTSKFKEISVATPRDYSLKEIEKLAAKYAPDAPDKEKNPPHIIVIMNEAFADLSILGDFTTDEPVTPFLSSLQEDVISGFALASVYGGNTANSEYEFLTGNSMAWLSPNAVPYQQYLRKPAYSLVSYLKSSYHYNCVAMHPYYASGWNRPDAYLNLGFDSAFFEDSFPKENYVRSYISDQEMAEQIIKTFENTGDQPLFLFGVTMQNHGAYNYQGPRPSEIRTPSLPNYHYGTSQYLSLLKETDKAMEYLISYFRQVKEDVVVVFFGDHQPKLSEAFYQDLGNTANTLEEIQARYKVPFFVWANYDIEEKQVECTSLNYLSNYLYDVADIPRPAYNNFLAAMQQQIPAINANGFYSLAANSFLPFEQASAEEKQWLNQYEQLQYNSMFDKKHKSQIFFPALTQ